VSANINCKHPQEVRYATLDSRHCPSASWSLGPGGASAQPAYNNCITLPANTTVVNPPLISSALVRGPSYLEVNAAATVPASVIGRQPLNFSLPYDEAKLYVPVLKVRFLDNGSQSQVRVTVKRTDLQGSQVTDLVVFDSNNPNLWVASAAYQTTPYLADPSKCASFDPFNDLDSVVVELYKTGSTGTPGLHSIQVCLAECQ
jgi:hypothetical protein